MMFRRTGFLLLLAGIAALGRPADVAGQPPVTLPLREARTLVVVDLWEGYSPISPTHSTYTLRRADDGSFTGTAQIRVGAGLLRRDTSFTVRLPPAAADSLLRLLSEVPVREGAYRPTLTHTDDYPTITMELAVGDSVVRFHTTSQGAAHVPWRVIAGTRAYVSASESIWPALGAVLNRIGKRQERAMIEAARLDPEAGCRHGFMAAPEAAPTQRPRYAAGEAWFARDSSITVEGRSYHKHGLPRIVAISEISPYGTYRGVAVFREAGSQGTPDFLYVPVRASCEVQPYAAEPRP